MLLLVLCCSIESVDCSSEIFTTRATPNTSVCFGREWTGDLKKLPNIKLRKVSKKGLDTKNEEEEKHEASEDENDEDDEEADEAVLMSDSN